MDSQKLDHLRSERFLFLETLYEICEGRTDTAAQQSEVAERLGLDYRQASGISAYLRDEGLLKYTAFGPLLQLTHDGVKEIEDAIAAPDTATLHFPPLVVARNFTHVEGSMIGSTIQQGASLSQTVGPAFDASVARELVDQLREKIATLSLNDDANAEVEAEIATVSAQIASPRPKSAILRESLASIRW